jgi:SpoIID/LytB domain protein
VDGDRAPRPRRSDRRRHRHRDLEGRGFDPRAFELGTLFAVDGEVIDTREVVVAIDPVARGKGAARAKLHATKYSVTTAVHAELVRRPRGTIVASSGGTTIANPSVIWLRPTRAEDTITVTDVPTNTGGSQLQTGKEDRRYWGAVYVTLGSDGKLTAVNAVPEDKLLAGLVPAEIFPDAPAAALEAQAIAARTELLSKLGHRSLVEPYLLCSTQQCQVYAGAGKEDPRTTRAVTATRGIVMLRDGGGLVDARYSASAGGHPRTTSGSGAASPTRRCAAPSTPATRRWPRSSRRSTTRTSRRSSTRRPPSSRAARRPVGQARHFRWTVELTHAADVSAARRRVPESSAPSRARAGTALARAGASVRCASSASARRP